MEHYTDFVKSAASIDEAKGIMSSIYDENPKHWPNGLSAEHFDGGLYLVRKSANHVPVGFVGWQERNNGMKKVGYYSVGILPEYRRAGFAKEAVTKLLEEKSAGVDVVKALVEKTNKPSIGLARLLDGVETEVTKSAFLMPGIAIRNHTEDLVRQEKLKSQYEDLIEKGEDPKGMDDKTRASLTGLMALLGGAAGALPGIHAGGAKGGLVGGGLGAAAGGGVGYLATKLQDWANKKNFEYYKEHAQGDDEESKEASVKQAEVRKEKDGYCVYSKKGRRMGGPYADEDSANKRLRQVEMFKHMKKASDTNLSQKSPGAEQTCQTHIHKEPHRVKSANIFTRLRSLGGPSMSKLRKLPKALDESGTFNRLVGASAGFGLSGLENELLYPHREGMDPHSIDTIRKINLLLGTLTGGSVAGKLFKNKFLPANSLDSTSLWGALNRSGWTTKQMGLAGTSGLLNLTDSARDYTATAGDRIQTELEAAKAKLQAENVRISGNLWKDLKDMPTWGKWTAGGVGASILGAYLYDALKSPAKPKPGVMTLEIPENQVRDKFYNNLSRNMLFKDQDKKKPAKRQTLALENKSEEPIKA